MKTLIGGIQLMDGRIEFGGHDVAKLGSRSARGLASGSCRRSRHLFSHVGGG